MTAEAITAPAIRNFVSKDFAVSSKADLEPYYQNLNERSINSVEELHQWLADWSELFGVFTEYSRWIYVRSTIDTSDEKAKAELLNLYNNIHPYFSLFENELKKKFIACPYTSKLDQNIFYPVVRAIKTEIEIFREENVPLVTEMNILQSRFDEISGAQSITYNGVELTLPQATAYLKSPDRAQRKEIYRLMVDRRLQDAEVLDMLLSDLIKLRHRIALNAGFKNYIEYRFAELGRFDYAPGDCQRFHTVIEKVVKPLIDEIFEKRKKDLKLGELKPWDIDVDVTGKPPLKPFNSVNELIEKTITCFNRLDPFFAECIEIMNNRQCLDLGSRLHKGVGGYNLSMPETGVPFIFMNSTNSEDDVTTMVHESGHAFHSFLSHPLSLSYFKEVPAEIAEVASMSMEMLTMDNWDIFYPDPNDLQRAKTHYLQYALYCLPRICHGDSFQFWMYENPNHSPEERHAKWVELNDRFLPSTIDWSGFEEALAIGYQRILHFFVVPFYFIEYGFAEFGAMAIWKNYKQDKQLAINNYKKALSLGYTKTIPQFYSTAGANFDFSENHIAELIGFMKEQLESL